MELHNEATRIELREQQDLIITGPQGKTIPPLDKPQKTD